MRRAHTFVAGLAVVAAGCHVRARNELSRPVVLDRLAHAEGAVARKPALVWGEAGKLRFIEPLDCPTDERYQLQTTIETTVRPNLATVTVGVITAAAGGVMLTAGLFSNKPGHSPYTALGAGGLVVGLPFAIGPFVGTGVEAEDQPATAPLTRPGPRQPCGDRPLAARAATIDVSGLSIYGAIAGDGGFEISPFDWIDAFDPGAVQAAQLTATIDAARTITAVLDRSALVEHAKAFLAHASFATQRAPLTVVPVLTPGAATISLDGAALRVVLPLRNTGGPAFAVRGQITAPGVAALDGRMIYVGQLQRGEAVERALVVPLAPTAASALRGTTIELSIELRDAYGTAPTTAIKLRGAL